MPDSLTESQRNKIIEITHDRINQANEAFDKTFPCINISFDVSGHTWGYYRRQGRNKSIRYNPEMFAQHFEEGISDTIPHEVAHYIVDALYLKRRKPHGSEWKAVMRLFGINNPRATHKTDVSNIPSRRQQRHTYKCGCQNHELSTTRHNKIQQRGMKYYCRRCGEKLFHTNFA